jgi:hypothetical protein
MDAIGWLLPAPTVLGLYGMQRAREIGLEDTLSWVLIPLLGLTVAGCALTAIIYGLMDTEKWNRLFNPKADSASGAGKTGWWTIVGLATALLIGATVLMSTIAFSFQHYFEYQMEAQLVRPSLENTKKAAN